MRLLVVDDDLDRHDIFEKKYRKGDFIVIHAYKYDDAITELKSTPEAFDYIFLDHDLGEIKDGTTIAKYMVEDLGRDQFKDKLRIVCHSMNPEGARRMGRILADAGFRVQITPFHLLGLTAT